jgi:hypothetical protein
VVAPPPRPTLPAPAPALPIPLALAERATYRISFGILGQLGELSIDLRPPSAAGDPVRVVGLAHGSLLGIGATEKRLWTEVDPASLGARRWTSLRASGGKTVTDWAHQPQPGMVALMRRRTGEQDRPDNLRRTVPVLDALTFLMRMRVTPPASPTVYEVLDGQGLWLLKVGPAQPVTEGSGPALRRVLRIDGRAEPIGWNGAPDSERSGHAFSLWLSADDLRTPLRLTMPLAVGEVKAELVSVSRDRPPRRAAQPETGARASADGRTVPPAATR